jgi:hypothetical protein
MASDDAQADEIVPPRKIPEGHVSIADSRYRNYFSVEPKTGRLFWAGQEIVARNTIDTNLR